MESIFITNHSGQSVADAVLDLGNIIRQAGSMAPGMVRHEHILMAGRVHKVDVYMYRYGSIGITIQAYENH